MGTGPPAPPSLRELVEAGEYVLVADAAAVGSRSAQELATGAGSPLAGGAEGLRFASKPRVERVASGLHWRTAVVTGTGAWSWELPVPPGGRLHLGLEALASPGAASAPPLEVAVAVDDGERRKALRVASPREIDAPGWLDLELDLDRWSGRTVRLEVTVRRLDAVEGRVSLASAGPPESGVELAWAPARVVAPGSTVPGTAAPDAVVPGTGTEAGDAAAALDAADRQGSAQERPSILLVVVDTLRPDYLSAYGGPRWNSPRIEQHLARRGVIFENAYAQAPWTLPSMVSLVTGVLPGVVLRGHAGAFAIPPEQPTLPELLSAAGYETAAFLGNPTLHQGNGFGRGLDDLYISPPETAFVTLEDELLVRKASAWLRARGPRPFYAHVHFLAPHDPYANPVQFLGRSPRRPFYLGRLTGRDVHELFLGTKRLDDPAEDVPHLAALYASEVRWVDRWVGELVEAIPAERRADTLIVLTSDHGEELHEHGDWKHGRTLYEEQLRVPLVVRWDAQLSQRRVAAPVRLMDVAPTLLEAAGLETPSRQASGRSLLGPLLEGGEPAAADVFAERLNFGPHQAAVVSRGKKLVLFDLYGEASAEGRMQERRVEEEAGRQPRIALYDLERDPLEHRNLIAEAPELAARLLPILHRGLDRTTPGLRVLAGRLAPGSLLEVVVRFDREPGEWRSYFLGAADGAAIVDRELRLDLTADVVEKGVAVVGDWERIESIEARLDGVEVAPARIWTPAGAAAEPPLALTALQGEAPGGGEAAEAEPPLLYLWVPAAGAAETPAPEPSAETLHRLRALGYL